MPNAQEAIESGFMEMQAGFLETELVDGGRALQARSRLMGPRMKTIMSPMESRHEQACRVLTGTVGVLLLRVRNLEARLGMLPGSEEPEGDKNPEKVVEPERPNEQGGEKAEEKESQDEHPAPSTATD